VDNTEATLGDELVVKKEIQVRLEQMSTFTKPMDEQA
jgi:predicted component of type VI protein secretion system